MTPAFEMESLSERALRIEGAGPWLEGRLHEGTGVLAAVGLHPHPHYGGDMHNHVVLAICETLAGLSASTLRFNFRGTGASDGAHDGGRGEVDDAIAAIGLLRQARPGGRLILCGYSFGAMVAANAAARESGLAALALVSPPLAMAPLPNLSEALPVLMVTGERDEIAPPSALAQHADTCTVETVPGADHSWWPGIDVLKKHLTTFVQRLDIRRT